MRTLHGRWPSPSSLLLCCVIVLCLISNSCLLVDAAKGKAKPEAKPTFDQTIEDVDADRIEEIVEDGDQHLVVFFYDIKMKCASCPDALKEMEEIDDDLEEDGLIEVVKSDDKEAMRQLGVVTLPALVYFRREHPILYDGDFEDSEEILRWIRYRDEVACVELDDDNFEDETDASSPDEGDLDWFIMFYDETDDDCAAFEPIWETVAHKLRGMVHVGKVDLAENDDVGERFKIDEEDECPEFYLFHKGKMYRYSDPALDVKSFVAFALHRYKEQRGHRVPDAPTALEEVMDDVMESLEDFITDHFMICAGFMLLGLLVTIGYGFHMFRKKRREQAAKDE